MNLEAAEQTGQLVTLVKAQIYQTLQYFAFMDLKAATMETRDESLRSIGAQHLFINWYHTMLSHGVSVQCNKTELRVSSASPKDCSPRLPSI